MRIDFVRSLEPALLQDPRSLFLTGDLGYAALEGLSAQLGKRFINAGVAEQNMMGAAAGMALAGFKPWIYSITPFVTYRCLEQIRNDVCLHNLPVRIVGNGGGYTYGIMGSTHHALEDLGALKTFPHLQLYFPGTNGGVASSVRQIHDGNFPSYLRLAISGFASNEVPLSENPETLTCRYAQASPGKAPVATIVGVGHAVQIALNAIKSFGDTFSKVDVFGLCRFPLQLEADRELVESVNRSQKLIVLDEHYLHGSIAESLCFALQPRKAAVILSAQYLPEQRYGSSTFHLKQCGLTPEALHKTLGALL